ncbi:hypothetical protein V3C99_017951 [Haemonchus contortus]|uniref:Uncharacterized protein n=1 Tax=Haemonchus contortus TaxID=6289 RepID=A0A7I4Z3H2_HAECO
MHERLHRKQASEIDDASQEDQVRRHRTDRDEKATPVARHFWKFKRTSPWTMRQQRRRQCRQEHRARRIRVGTDLYGSGEKSILSSKSASVSSTSRLVSEDGLKSSSSGPTQRNGMSRVIMPTHSIYINSQFQKPCHARWTWESPGGQFHNGIDHIFVSRKFCLFDSLLFQSSAQDPTIVYPALGSAFQCVEREQRSPVKKLRRKTLKERRAAILAEAAEAGKSIRGARRSIINYKIRMTTLRNPDETITASRRTMKKVIYVYSDLFDSHVYLPT